MHYKQSIHAVVFTAHCILCHIWFALVGNWQCLWPSWIPATWGRVQETGAGGLQLHRAPPSTSDESPRQQHSLLTVFTINLLFSCFHWWPSTCVIRLKDSQ